MTERKKNIFLTGAPSSGKTTVIRKVISRLGRPVGGFYTEEERREGRRVGFVLKGLDGRSGYLAREGFQSAVRLRRYGISIENIETIAVPSLMPRKGYIIILDEIGKMECFSDLFQRAATAALDSDNIVVGTITLGGDAFIQSVKRRGDLEIHEVTPDNRNDLPDLILQRVEHFSQ